MLKVTQLIKWQPQDCKPALSDQSWCFPRPLLGGQIPGSILELAWPARVSDVRQWGRLWSRRLALPAYFLPPLGGQGSEPWEGTSKPVLIPTFPLVWENLSLGKFQLPSLTRGPRSPWSRGPRQDRSSAETSLTLALSPWPVSGWLQVMGDFAAITWPPYPGLLSSQWQVTNQLIPMFTKSAATQRPRQGICSNMIAALRTPGSLSLRTSDLWGQMIVGLCPV